MTRPPLGAETWARLRVAPRREPATFDAATLEDLPPPARRLLRRALPAGCPLHGAVELTMTGEIKLRGRWLPFRAEQILRHGVGFVWRPAVGGRLVRFVGADLLGPDDARTEFALHGVIPVARDSGSEVARSAVGRLAAETVVWLPAALTPQVGTQWSPKDAERALARVAVPGGAVDIEVVVDEEGRLLTLGLSRWNAAATPSEAQPFGGRLDAEHLTSGGVRIVGSGAVGWGWGTPCWREGEFFRFTISAARLLP